jgi:oxygen-independent coproporphyrinogen-3 oxidase
VARGLALDADDRLRRDAIMALMCQGRLDFDAIERAHGIAFERAFARELEALAPLESSGLVVLAPRAIEVTALGWYFVRRVAMVFDRWLRVEHAPERYARVV